MDFNLISKHRSALMGCAILWVMLYHLLGQDKCNSYGMAFFSLGHGGVDIFFFLSGMGLTYTYYDKLVDKRKIIEYIKKRITKILPTYLLVIIITCLAHSRSLNDILWEISCVGFWIGKPYYDWYIPSLLILYLLFPLYVYCSHRKGIIKTTLLFIILGLLLTCVLIASWKGTPILFFSRIPIFFIGNLIGYLLSHRLEVINIKKKYYVLIILTSIIIFFGELYLTMHLDAVFLRKSSLHHLPFALIIPGMLLLISYVFEKIKSFTIGTFFTTSLSFVGSISLETYLCHMSLRYDPFYIYIPIALIFAYILHLIMYTIYPLKWEPIK